MGNNNKRQITHGFLQIKRNTLRSKEFNALSVKAKLAYLNIYYFYENKDVFLPVRYEDLPIKLSKKAWYLAVKELSDAGFVIIEPGIGQGSNQYLLCEKWRLKSERRR